VVAVTPDLPLTTGPAATRAYRLGVTCLLAGCPGSAASAFRRAVAEDPCFAAGHAALAAVLAELDDADAGASDALVAAAAPQRCSRRVSRAERHHVELVLLALDGRTARASCLGGEHLAEFPGDALVRHVLARWCEPAA
jgi:hypothetical protein